VLNARDNVTEFYARHGYAVVGEAETLFGTIRHVRMAKILP
jgi:predicted GNAT family N-acyltransferase